MYILFFSFFCILSICVDDIFIVQTINFVYRSKGIFQPSNTYEKGETSHSRFSKTAKRNSTNKRNRKSLPSAPRNIRETITSEYFVLNNLNKPENIKATYTDTADGEYDVLNDKQNRRKRPTENVYHSHDIHQNEDGHTYESANFRKGNSTDVNGLYDTSLSVVVGNYSYMSYKNRDNEMTTDIYDKST